MYQGHQLPFIVLQALNFIHSRKPTKSLTAWKIISHTMSSVTKPWTASGGYSSSSARSRRQQAPPPPETLRPCQLKLRVSCGIYGIPNECLSHLPRHPLVHLARLFNYCLRLSHFRKSWKEAKIIMLPKPGKDPKFPQNLRPISLLSTTGKLVNYSKQTCTI
jgi:hypothetical protein